MHKNKQIAELLLEAGANITDRDNVRWFMVVA
jgi:hypothetical protein